MVGHLIAILIFTFFTGSVRAEGPTPAEQRARLEQKRAEFRAILNEVTFRDWSFRLEPLGDGFFLQARFTEKNHVTGKEEPQGGRKWYVSSWSVPNEIVQTALKAVVTAAEHETRENFTVNGHAVLGPHFNHDAWAKTLAKMAGREPVAPVPTVERVLKSLSGVKYRDWKLETGEMSRAGERGAYFQFIPPDGRPMSAARYLPATATEEEIAHATFNAVMEEEGAKIRETFAYQGRSLFSRSAGCMNLMIELIEQGKFDTRH